jgi:hypothetical protein
MNFLQSSVALGRALRRIEPALAARGVVMEWERVTAGTRIRFRMTGQRAPAERPRMEDGMVGRAYALAMPNPSVSAALGRYGDGRLARADLSTPVTAAMPDPLTPAELPQAAEPAPVPRRAADDNNPQPHGLPGSGCAVLALSRLARFVWSSAWPVGAGLAGFGSVGALHGE